MTESPERRSFRLTPPTLLVVVTVLAVGVGVWQHANHLRNRETFHKLKALGYTLWHSGRSVQLSPPAELAAYREKEARFQALAEYHIAMSHKCRRAIWRPWVELESDPIEPAHPSDE